MTNKKNIIVWILFALIVIAAVILIVYGHLNKLLWSEITGESLLALDIAINITINIKMNISIRKKIVKNVDGPVGISDTGDVNFNYNNVLAPNYSRDIELANDPALTKALFNIETNIKHYSSYDDATCRIRTKHIIAANNNVVSNSRYQFNDNCLKDLFSKIVDRVEFFHDIEDRDVVPLHMEYHEYKRLTDELIIWIRDFYRRVTEIAK